jgi:hypothetical protein
MSRVHNALRALGQPSAAQVEAAVQELMTDLVFLCMHHSYNLDAEALFDAACDAYDHSDAAEALFNASEVAA